MRLFLGEVEEEELLEKQVCFSWQMLVLLVLDTAARPIVVVAFVAVVAAVAVFVERHDLLAER